jgi:hypothetical protein
MYLERAKRQIKRFEPGRETQGISANNTQQLMTTLSDAGVLG